jgi:hypothetical protein
VNTFASIANWWIQQSGSLQFFWSVGFCGLALIAVQGILSIFVGHHDVNAAEQGAPWEGYISLKTLSAVLIGLGFGGAVFGQNGFSITLAFAGGLGIGIFTAAFFLVLMNGLSRLRSDGTVMLWEAIGQRGTVYMRIPANEAGPGEIQVAFAGRMVNVQAFTCGAELPTGTDVLVVSLHGEHALKVEKISKDQLTLT